MNRYKKICIITLILIIICSFFYIVSGTDNFNVNAFETPAESNKIESLTRNTLGVAISITRIVATGTLLIILTVIAIKYMLSSAGDRADIKKHAVAYVIAALIIFCSTFIIEILINLGTGINN